MSIAFVVFHEYPDTMRAITDHVNTAIKQIDIFDCKKKGRTCMTCAALLCCIPCILSRFGTILALIDKLIGDFGIVHVAEFIANIAEVFCKHVSINLVLDIITQGYNTTRDVVGSLANVLRPLISHIHHLPGMDRKSKWAPLDIANTIRDNVAKFEDKSSVVQRTVNSFEAVFKAVEAVEGSFERLMTKHKSQSAVEETSLIAASDIMSEQVAMANQVSHVGGVLQLVETIVTYGILSLSDEQHTLDKLLDDVDEVCRVLNKFVKLHVVYKVICGVKYLSKLSIHAQSIVNLLQHSGLRLDSPGRFVDVLKRSYLNLIFTLFESVVGDKIQVINDILDAPAHLQHEAERLANEAREQAGREVERAAREAHERAEYEAQRIANEARQRAEHEAQRIANEARNALNNVGRRFGF
jgi:vacuolar-type H+-ATPase subunit H